MPLNVRSISMSFAVICFFGIAVIGWISGLSQLTCCKRALTGAIVGYVITTIAVKMINSILLNAIIKSQMNKQAKEETGAYRD